MAQNPYINKVEFGGTTLMDLTEDSVNASNLLEGETAHNAAGAPITGTAKQGHIIQNPAGTSMTQRGTLQLEDMHLEDDNTVGSEKTKAKVVKDETSSAFEQETEAGLYHITDEPDGMLTGANVYYKNGESVEDALDTLYDGTGEYEEVVADGVKTYGQLLNELYALVDTSKLTASTKLVIDVPNVSTYVLAYTTYIKSTNKILFNTENGSSLNFTNVASIVVASSGSLYQAARIQTNGNVYSDYTSEVVPSSSTIRLYYSAITKIINETESDSVSVTADGVKTYATLLNELYTKIDKSKLTPCSKIVTISQYGTMQYDVVFYTNSTIIASQSNVSASDLNTDTVILSNASTYYQYRNGSSGDVSSTVLNNGGTITLYYTSTSRVIESCESQNVAYRGTNVRSALDGLRANQIKQTTVEGTTDQYGVLVTSYTTSSINILSAISAAVVVSPFVNAGYAWRLRCVDPVSGSVKASTAVSIAIYYLEV